MLLRNMGSSKVPRCVCVCVPIMCVKLMLHAPVIFSGVG